MATNSKQLKPLDIPFKEFMPGQVIQSVQFNDDMRDIEDTVNELVNEHNIVSEELSNHVDNFENPHQVDAHQTGTYNATEIDEFFQDVRSGNLDDNAITNRVLDDECVDTRNYMDNSITASKLDISVGNQIDISKNISITDKYTKDETDELIRSKVGEGTYSKDELDTKFEQVQAGQILDKSISINQIKDSVGTLLDISQNQSIIDRYTRDEVDLLIQNNALPRDWGSILEEDNYIPVIPTKEITLPVANHMKVNTCTVSESSILDIDIQENVGARGEFNTVGERLNSFDSQIKNIENEMQNIGKPTDEQVANIINQAIANGDIVAGGITSTAKTLLINILRNAVYTNDQSANITALDSALNTGIGGGSNTKQYTITNTLSNASTSNTSVLVNENSSYTATITANNGYELNAITVTMGGIDITSTVVSGTIITISAVTGNVVITVTTTATSSGGGSGLPQDSLVGFFDFRSAIVENPYHLTGWGNVAKLTTPSCSDYFIFNNSGTYTVSSDYGVANWGSRGIRQMVNETTKLSINNNSNSTIGLVYGQCICALHGMITTTNISNSIKFTPKYVNSSGETKSLASIDIFARNYKDVPGYSLYALTQSATELKLYINGELKATVNSSECTDFDHWNFSVDSPYGCHYGGVDNYSTAFAIYNKTLSPVEVVEATVYFKTLEVK